MYLQLNWFLSAPSIFLMSTKINELTQDALDAFWEVIAKQFPNAKSGDLSPLVSFHLTQAAESAVRAWVSANIHKCRRTKSTRITSPRATHTAGPWSVTGTEMDCARYWIWAPGKSQYIASVGLLDEPKNTDYANARLIAAAPGLRAMVQTAKSAFSERLSCLCDERREVLRCDDDVSDFDDQIDHYEALVRQCDTVLKESTAG